MKILNWNIWIDNPNQIKNLKQLIEIENPDIVCLQEANEKTLEFCKLLTNYNYCHCIDFARPINQIKSTLFNKPSSVSYLITLSKYPIIQTQTDLLHTQKPNTFLAKHKGINNPREFQYIDILKNNDLYRIFNLHLEMAAGSKRRISEFQRALKYYDETKNNIICGDFNIFARPTLNLLTGWGLGLSIREYFVNERRAFQKIFDQYSFDNIFKRKVTYPKFRLQLDHILIPKEFNILSKKIPKNLLDSDHRYLVCEIE